MKEKWVRIKKYKKLYAVSNYGRIKSKDRIRVMPNGGTHFIPGRIMKLSLSKKTGYLRVCLTKNGVQKYYSVHRLVAEHFIPNPYNKPEVNHIGKDGDKTNNRSDNLEWSTTKENCDHAFSVGLRKPMKQKGSDNYASKLTERRVLSIRARIKSGQSQRSIAKEEGVSTATICLINQRKLWSHI